MTELKTKLNENSVVTFLNSVEDEKKRNDCFAIIDLIKQVTGLEPVMWGRSIVGFGSYHYRYDSGYEGDSVLTGFSPRKQNISIYFPGGFQDDQGLMNSLGKFKTGEGCLYIKKLADVNTEVLKELIGKHVEYLKKTYS